MYILTCHPDCLYPALLLTLSSFIKFIFSSQTSYIFGSRPCQNTQPVIILKYGRLCKSEIRKNDNTDVKLIGPVEGWFVSRKTENYEFLDQNLELCGEVIF